MELPGIGRGIGAAIVEIVNTGSWSQLDRLCGTLEPEKLFQTIPGIGPALAAEIHDEPRGKDSHSPPIRILLDVDREYLTKAFAGSLRKIAPKRFNPEG